MSIRISAEDPVIGDDEAIDLIEGAETERATTSCKFG